MSRSRPVQPLLAALRWSWPVALILAGGCSHWWADVQDPLARRVTPARVGRAEAPGHEGAEDVSGRAAPDAMVRPASATRSGEGRDAPPEGGPRNDLPPAIEPPQAAAALDRPRPSGPSLPFDPDAAALDAIAATGKPLTLPEAIAIAFRAQPRLRAQLESIAQARGRQGIAYSAFLPIVGGLYHVGGLDVHVAGSGYLKEAEALPAPEVQLIARLFSVLALHRSGSEREAVQLLDDAVRTMQAMDLSAFSWTPRVILERVRREAEDLRGTKKEDNPPP